jgi:serine/threonine protein kinase
LPADGDFDATYFASDDKESTASWIYPVVVALVGVVALAIIVAATFLYRRKKQRAINATRSVGGLSGGSAGSHQSVLDNIRDDEELAAFRIPQEDVTTSRVLAKGGFGVVWIATLRGSETIVAKQLLPEKGKNPRVVANFVEEIRLCSKLDHPKIVRFLGLSWSTLADLSILLEYMPNGDLAHHLRKCVAPKSSRRRDTPAPEDVYAWTTSGGLASGRTKLQLALDVAEALVYLHSFDKPIIHRDLKAQNVLLSSSWEAKLTDFGVSREVDEAMTAEVGTVAWIAPEILKGKVYSEQADIYSFGVLLSEMDTHDNPYANGIPDAGGNGNQAASNARIALAVIEKRLQPSFRSECPPDIVAIARRCLSYEPSDRPTAEELVRELVDVARPSEASSLASSDSAHSSGGSAGSFVVV